MVPMSLGQFNQKDSYIMHKTSQWNWSGVSRYFWLLSLCWSTFSNEQWAMDVPYAKVHTWCHIQRTSLWMHVEAAGHIHTINHDVDVYMRANYHGNKDLHDESWLPGRIQGIPKGFYRLSGMLERKNWACWHHMEYFYFIWSRRGTKQWADQISWYARQCSNPTKCLWYPPAIRPVSFGDTLPTANIWYIYFIRFAWKVIRYRVCGIRNLWHETL